MMKNVKAYLYLLFDFENLPEIYQKALDDNDCSQFLCLPWPAEHIPQFGSTIHNAYFPSGFEHLKVTGCEYEIDRDEIRVEIAVEPVNKSHPDLFSKRFDAGLFHGLAEQGFMFTSNKKLIKEVLEEACLLNQNLL